MGFATRCTSCNTVFRVVPDQLKVSEGWVRCGRCHEVFDAQETLFVLDAAPDATPAWSDTPPPAAGALPASGPALHAESGPAPPSTPGGTFPPASDEDLSFASGDAAPPAAAVALAPDVATPSHAEDRAGRAPQTLGDVPDPPAPLPDPQAAAPASGAPTAATPAQQAADREPGADAPHRALEAAAAATPSAHAAPTATAGWSAPVFGVHSRTGRDAADDTPASRLAARDRVEFEDARFNSELFADDPGVDVAEPAVEAPMPRAEDGTTDAASTQPHATPEFLRRAERNARWNRPTVVVAMVLVCGVLLLALAAQAAHHFRDLAAASYPQLRPALLALCEVAGCRIEPVRRIDEIVIESSALTDAPTGDAMRLSVVLRNRSALPLAMPAIELALTDAAGQMLARRALLPADFGKTGATLPAGAETPLHLVLAVDGRRPSGYTVEPFYP